jgi:hypothetical protein
VNVRLIAPDIIHISYRIQPENGMSRPMGLISEELNREACGVRGRAANRNGSEAPGAAMNLLV